MKTEKQYERENCEFGYIEGGDLIFRYEEWLNKWKDKTEKSFSLANDRYTIYLMKDAIHLIPNDVYDYVEIKNPPPCFVGTGGNSIVLKVKECKDDDVSVESE